MMSHPSAHQRKLSKAEIAFARILTILSRDMMKLQLSQRFCRIIYIPCCARMLSGNEITFRVS